MDDMKLLPCPFCGGSNLKVRGDDKVVSTCCEDCGAIGPNQYDSRFDWNQRTAMTAPKVKPLPRAPKTSSWELDPTMLMEVTHAVEAEGWDTTLEPVEVTMLDAERRILSALQDTPKVSVAASILNVDDIESRYLELLQADRLTPHQRVYQLYNLLDDCINVAKALSEAPALEDET